MGKGGCFFPGEGFAQNAVVPLRVEALVEGIEEHSIKDLVETFEVLDILPEHEGVLLRKVGGHLHHDRLLLDFPEQVEDFVWDDHDVALVFVGVD